MVVHAEVEDDIPEACVAAILLNDEEGRRLLAAAVASRRLGGVEAVQQSLLERPSGRGLKGLGEGVDGRAGDEDVPLRRVARSGPAAGPVLALVPGERRATALTVDHAELPVLPVVVRGGQPLDDVLGREPFVEQREPVRPVARVRVRLRGHRADTGLGPRHDRADAEELRSAS